MPFAYVVTVSAVFGLVIGSFLNVVVWRVPRGESVVSPPSACPKCGHLIRRYDNVPVVSWLVLRAKCRDCGARISGRYPAVESGTAVLFGLAAWLVLSRGQGWAIPAFAYLAAIAVALSLIDIDVHRLPDSIVLPSYGVGVALLALASWNPGGTSDWPALGRAAVGALAMFALYLVILLVYPAGMGWGDVKLAGVLGLYLGWVGWGALVVGWFAAFLLGGLYSVALLATRRASRKSGIPFGPWMLAGAIVGVAAGPWLWETYLAAVS
jgi:leader peptidase (prepilin peptidase)/N-methyltransferase